jgi:hypothetical protein
MDIINNIFFIIIYYRQMDKEEIKKTRLELLAKARQAKKDKKQAQLEAQLAERKQEQPVEESVKKYKSP